MRRAATALTFEPDEAPVISNELLGANVVSIRADLTDFRAEFRAVIVRIEHDIRDKKIDTKVDELRADIKDIRSDINEIRGDIKAMFGSIADLKGMQKAILWVLGGIGSAIAILGAGLTIAKTLHWI